MLTEQKAELKHNEWGKWLNANVIGPGFSRATVNNYMKLFEERDELKILNVRNLAEAYRVLYRKDEEPQERNRKEKDRNTKEGGEVTNERVLELHYPSERETEVKELLTKLGEWFGTEREADTIYEALKYVKEHFNVKVNSATDKAA